MWRHTRKPEIVWLCRLEKRFLRDAGPLFQALTEEVGAGAHWASREADSERRDGRDVYRAVSLEPSCSGRGRGQGPTTASLTLQS